MSNIPPNPLDTLFGIENGVDLDKVQKTDYAITTEKDFADAKAGEVVGVEDPNAKDDEDTEIDKKIDEIYDAAIDAFKTQTAYTEIIEPRYAARNAEVAANYLNIALNAANSRAKVKTERKKTNAFIPYQNGGSKHASGTVVASREEIMKMLDDAN